MIFPQVTKNNSCKEIKEKNDTYISQFQLTTWSSCLSLPKGMESLKQCYTEPTHKPD